MMEKERGRAMEKEENIPCFSILPIDCISKIISFASPNQRDACRWSILSQAFKYALESDAVWERFLPSDYEEIIARSISLLTYSSKRDLYFQLCNSPVLIDGGKLSFRLTKATGTKCYMLSAREFQISKDRSKWTSSSQSRFPEVAKLLASWVKIRCKIQAQMLSSNTNYGAYLVFQLQDYSRFLYSPDERLLRYNRKNGDQDGANAAVSVNVSLMVLKLTARKLEAERYPQIYPRKRRDGWMEIKLGEFFNNLQEDDHSTTVEIMFKDPDCLYWTLGFLVEGIEFRPVKKYDS